jgi:lysophospholipase L1-like esterase
VGVTRFFTGDGRVVGSPRGNLLYLVTSVDRENDWLFGLALDPGALPEISTTISHTYAQAGEWTAFIDTCCRIFATSAPNAHINNPSASYRIETRVNTASEAPSPVTVMPPIVQCPIEGECVFTVPASDPAGDGLAFRFSTPGESGIQNQPGPPHAPHAATIDPDTGLFEWNTEGATVASGGLNTLYSTQVTIEDRRSDGSLRSKVALDFFIQLVEHVGEGPVFDQSQAPPGAVQCGTTVPAVVGQEVRFTAWGFHPAGDEVTLNVVGLPRGATLDPSLPHSVAGLVTSAFSWTPEAADQGFNAVTFIASDAAGQGAQCPVMILVEPTGPGRYVAMGDSYASGEGAPPFAEGTSIANVNECHRSLAAGSRVVAASPDTPALASHVACSGATTIELDTGMWNEVGQYEQLDDTVSLVTISIGGNDVGFAPHLTECIIRGFTFRTCHGQLDDIVTDAIVELEATLREVHSEIRRRAPGARILVQGYPRFFTEEGTRRLCEGVRRADQRWMNEKLRQLNEVSSLAAHARTAQFVDVYDLYDGDELCSSLIGTSSSMNGIRPFNIVHSFHPTSEGQRLLGEALLGALGETTAGWNIRVFPLQQEQVTVPVGPGQQELSAFSSWPGSDVVMSLESPSGRVIDRSTEADDVTHDVGPSYEHYAVLDPEPGEWTVTLFGADVGSDGLVTSLSVETVEPRNIPPVAVVTQHTDGATVTLSAAGSHDPDGEIVSFEWDLDDGTVLEGEQVTYTYEQPGVFVPTLIVTDDAGAAGFGEGDAVEIAATVEFEGFDPPVDGDVRTVEAGRTIPLKWSVQGEDADDAVVDYGFDEPGATLQVVRAGPNWHVNARTPRDWRGERRSFTVTLADGREHAVTFEFR